jgi:hypothetical protein
MGAGIKPGPRSSKDPERRWVVYLTIVVTEVNYDPKIFGPERFVAECPAISWSAMGVTPRSAVSALKKQICEGTPWRGRYGNPPDLRFSCNPEHSTVRICVPSRLLDVEKWRKPK